MVLHKETVEVLISKLSILEILYFTSVFKSFYSLSRLKITLLQILSDIFKFGEKQSL
jgi:hypothetical protein